MTKKRIAVHVAVVVLNLFSGCMAEKTQPQMSDLLGTWKTATVQTEWGACVIEVTFQSASDIEFKMTPSTGGQSMLSKGKYRLSGRQLVSEAINKGEPVSVWLERNHLVLQTPSEAPQHFTRK